jgi:hypothetical protein
MAKQKRRNYADELAEALEELLSQVSLAANKTEALRNAYINANNVLDAYQSR